MILHIFEDDKFADYAIRQFNENAPDNNHFVVFVQREDFNCKYIHLQEQTEKIIDGSQAFEHLCKDLNKYSAMILHGISRHYHVRLIEEAKGKTKVAWVFWGFELYSRKERTREFMGPLTKKLYRKYTLYQGMKATYRLLARGKRQGSAFLAPKNIYRKIDYCLTDMKEDFNLAKSYFNSSFDFRWYNYYDIDETLGELKEKRVNGNNILIGNSATFSNNHLEVLEILKNIELGNRKLIVPLSYNIKVYAEQIGKKGTSLFEENFVPLMEYIERKEYNELIRSCSIVIMNHYRHQAMGNLITALWLGAKVFMSDRSTTYSYFKRLGLHILNIEKDLRFKSDQVFDPLDDKLVRSNREILLKEYGKKIMNKRIGELIDTLTN